MIGSVLFDDRAGAGRLLAQKLLSMHISDPVVLALPRGGVPLAHEVAAALDAPLDLLLVRKIGVPWQPELATAAVVDGERADIVLNDEVMNLAGLAPSEIEAAAARELREIERRRRVYLAGRMPVPTAGTTVILVDDGIATGTTVQAGLVALGRRGAKRLILAVPVAPADTLSALSRLVDDVVCLATPDPFYAIGAYYRDFHQLSDEDVIHILSMAQSSDKRGNDAKQAPAHTP